MKRETQGRVYFGLEFQPIVYNCRKVTEKNLEMVDSLMFLVSGREKQLHYTSSSVLSMELSSLLHSRVLPTFMVDLPSSISNQDNYFTDIPACQPDQDKSH